MPHSDNHSRRYYEDPLQLFPKALTKAYSAWVSLTYPFASKGRKLDFHFTSHVNRQRACRISLGNSVSLRNGAWLNVVPRTPPVIP